MERAYRQSTRLVGGLLFVLGLTMVAVTIAEGGGVLAVGVLVGAMLAAIGGGRVLLSRESRHDREPA
ncbi:MAG: hypothetical protein M3340_08750 [Actinomycetota bacterium]|nr:hypothetical protein [Actinomycetota bacterium]